MRLIWDKEAWDDLDNIYNIQIQIHENDGKAKNKCLLILSESEILQAFPCAGKIEEYLAGRDKQYRSLVVIKGDYKIIYHIDPLAIHIIAIWDCRRNPKEMYKEINRNK